ncbi:type II toxin-antitoxin system RelE/ParE family toxin [Marinospirillum insulare]|uniref:Toxin RelE n=1 Tax=Marinospirillum insulare TaxID=217169 RepID=A0ABQ6A2L3_9GAMM|nr:type II toxin-antitoxin system RelE/ParE family toxin [Marinospirillum insulare]GLR64473.1 toxin RelE [Marinospirillum insulare]
MWEIVTVNYFDQWFLSLSNSEQQSILVGIFKLKEFGPMLGRPDVDTLKKTKKVRNLKELRIQHNGKPYRIFFAFDPLRQAVMLCGGNKSGEKRFYEDLLPIAEKEFLNYLQTLR